MRYEPEKSDKGNIGLQNAIDFLEPIKQKYPWITYADLWTLASCVAIEHMGGYVLNDSNSLVHDFDDLKLDTLIIYSIGVE
jgi:cytochrome c peroxidase